MEQSQEKTEEPSLKKLTRAQREGDFPFSQEFCLAISLVGSVGVGFVLFPKFVQCALVVFRHSFSNLNKMSPEHAMREAFSAFLVPVMLFFCAAMMCTLAAHFMQRKFLFFPFKLKWDFYKKRPSQLGYRIGLWSLKMGALLFCAYYFLAKRVPQIGPFFIFSALLFLSLAVIDLLYQRWHWKKRQKMTKQEVKEEKKESEGSQEVKQKMRSALR